jgi:protease IV
MRQFFKTLLAVIFGNVIFYGIFFLFFILLIVGAVVSASDEAKVDIPSSSILKLQLNSGLSDMSENQGFNFGATNESTASMSIFDLVGGIKKAKNDSKIKGIWLALNYNEELTYAQIDIIRAALKEFKTSKKPVFAYGETVSQKMYYLSSLADKVYVNPNGGLDVRGFGAQLTFFKNTLDRLEIQPQIFYAGKFKSATEPLRLDKMSEENRQQTRELLSDIAENVVGNIAQDRKLSAVDVNAAINQMKTNIPQEATATKLIDGVKYIDEVESELKKMTKIDAEDKLTMTSIQDYISDKTILDKSGDIAVYVCEGNIIDGKSQEGSFGSATVVRDIRALAENDAIKGVVLRVNSPGGSALASAVMLREINLLKKKKPVVVSMGNYAASGGYYIASSGTKIFAEPNTITGSIGVFGIIPNIGKMLNNKLGVTFDEVELHEHAVVGINKKFDAIEAAKMQQEIDYIYTTFKTVVSEGRKITMDSVESIAQGRVWSGERAKQIKLVDEIGGLDAAIKYTASITKSDASSYYFSNQRKSQFEQFMEEFSASALVEYFQSKWLKSMLGDYATYFESLKSYQSMRGAQARMMYQVVI